MGDLKSFLSERDCCERFNAFVAYIKTRAPSLASQLEVENGNFKSLVSSWRTVSQLHLGKSGKTRQDKGNVFASIQKVSMEAVNLEYYSPNEDGSAKILPFGQFISSLVQAVSRGTAMNTTNDVTFVKFSDATWRNHPELAEEVKGLEIVFFPPKLSYFELHGAGFTHILQQHNIGLVIIDPVYYSGRDKSVVWPRISEADKRLEVNSWNHDPMTGEQLILVLKELRRVLTPLTFKHLNIVVFGGAEQVR